MSAIPDPFRAGVARGWKVMGGPHAAVPATLTCDVVVVGTGAGGGITAELLARAGLDVILVEEGPLRTSSDFDQHEATAYPALYQESAARKTTDKAINILQGRCVGGSTTVNWTSSFRTPPQTLAHWEHAHGLAGHGAAAMAPFFEQVERRLGITPWLTPPNVNNDLLQRGGDRLGIPVASIQRNVRGCWNLGSCGMGCPTNAKQSMLVTTIPAALERGARLLVETSAVRLQLANGRARSLHCVSASRSPARVSTEIRARHFVLAAGAINTPALLLRSEAPDPHGRLGERTFLHPTVLSAALMGDKVEAWQGAPQTLYTDHFLQAQAIDGPIGFKVEAAPLHPVIFASTVTGLGREQSELLRQFAYTHVLVALLRDGFHPEAAGGRVHLRSDGSAALDYPLTPFVLDGVRRAYLAMAELQFAAGARQVMPIHEFARPLPGWAETRAAIAALPMQPRLAKVASAHVMGGCAMAGDERQGVVTPAGRHWQLDNVSVHDGSVFPTSVGANPQLSIYGFANRMAQGLASHLGAGTVTLA